MSHDLIIFLSFLGGLMPALVWLVFWLGEDRKRPEPPRLLLRTFVFGMFAVFLVLPLQKLVDSMWPGITFLALLLWAFAEEILKFGAAFFGGLNSPEDDEPLDPMIYMITASLGFVSLENALFLATPLLNNDIVAGIITGNMRFLGASLLHVATSGIVGLALAVSFYKSRKAKVFALILGLILATAIHTAFNLIIIKNPGSGFFFGFLAIWMIIIGLILSFERVKMIARPN